MRWAPGRTMFGGTDRGPAADKQSRRAFADELKAWSSGLGKAKQEDSDVPPPPPPPPEGPDDEVWEREDLTAGLKPVHRNRETPEELAARKAQEEEEDRLQDTRSPVPSLPASDWSEPFEFNPPDYAAEGVARTSSCISNVDNKKPARNVQFHVPDMPPLVPDGEQPRRHNSTADY